ncbi:MAG: aldehyde dehydrogenase family protein [Gammaproteobacteria bacterium]|nr:MAG: aldehyde dehydrogenase family protein [Gammaproteobacteria bacterium]
MDAVEKFPLMVPGAKPAGELLDVVSPWDGSLLAQCETAGQKAVDKALETAYGLYRDQDAQLSAATRIEVLKNAARIMQEQAETLAIEAAREGGKPLVDSRVEVARAIDGVNNCADLLRSESGREIPMSINAASEHHLAVTTRVPIGVVVAVSAFNHPLNLIVHQVGPAIAAGCPVVIKPAEDTPLSCFRFVRILREAGLPETWCQPLVTSDLSVAEQLATDQRVGFFSFIGSARVGWMLRSKLTPGARCALEHGGAAPVIVAQDANITEIAPAIAKAAFYHAGQVCVSAQRIYVHASQTGAFAQELARLGAAMKVGDPVKDDTDIGPLIRPRETERVHQWVQEAKAAGAQILCGGEPLSARSYPATVLLNPPDDANVSCMEIFGPVACVYSYDEMDDAIAQANALPFAFQAAVFTSNIDTAMHAYRRLDASAVMVNDHTAFRVDWMPFAGLHQSGLGVGGISYTYRDMTVEKMLVLRSNRL